MVPLYKEVGELGRDEMGDHCRGRRCRTGGLHHDAKDDLGANVSGVPRFHAGVEHANRRVGDLAANRRLVCSRALGVEPCGRARGSRHCGGAFS
jgi:hypothetical protein